MEGFKQIWANMESIDGAPEKVAYGAGVATGLVGLGASAVFGTKMVFDWFIDCCDEFETRTITRIMRKMDASRRVVESKGISTSAADKVSETKSVVNWGVIARSELDLKKP